MKKLATYMLVIMLFTVNSFAFEDFDILDEEIVDISLEEARNNEEMRNMDKGPLSPWKLLIAVTVFQILTIVQLVIGMGLECTYTALLSIVLLSLTMWIYVVMFRTMGSKGFEMEIIAFFMSTISLAVTISSAPENAMKQLTAVLIGIVLFVFMCIYLRDIERTKKAKPAGDHVNTAHPHHSVISPR